MKENLHLIGEKYSKDLIAYKVILIGLSGSGKSTITMSIVKNEFLENLPPTISLDVSYYQVKVNDKIIQLQFWDACGNDEFAANTPNLFKNTSLAIIVYAINNRKSFLDIGKWYNILRGETFECISYLIGNKNDLENERDIQINEGEKLKKDYNFDLFLETSAKTDINITSLIKNIAISIYKKIGNQEDINEGRIELKKDELKKANSKDKKRKKHFKC